MDHKRRLLFEQPITPHPILISLNAEIRSWRIIVFSIGEDQMRLTIHNVTFAGKPLAEMSITEIRDAREYLAKRIQTLQWLTQLVIDHHP
jgi:hypothetical protein